ncbi:MAG TPA: hypothetical protein PLN64_01645 [Candidatus Bipolaricaulis anaerobius]|nr:hypothetical protein [Candidatus Bipolaricaulis anaerobius]
MKATDEQILAAYAEHGSVDKAGAALGMCGASVHSRLVKLGANVPLNLWTDNDDVVLRREYHFHADAGKLEELARRLGRTKPFICRKARDLGLTKKDRAKPYLSTWKYLSEEAARGLLDRLKASRLGAVAWCRSKGYDPNGFARAMKRYFPDEWEHVIEAKVPRQTMYRLGRAVEYRTRDDLKRLGYFVLRSPASKSPVDLAAVKPGIVLLVQCKRSLALGVAEWNELLDLARTVGAVPVLAGSPTGRGITYLRLLERKDGSKRAQPFEPFDPSATESEAIA